MDKRLKNEIEHGRFLHESGAGEIWNWETPAGKKRLNRRIKMLTDHLASSMTVLELGCGAGYFTKEIVQTRCKLTAIDISPELIEGAKQKVKDDNVTFQLDNAYGLSFANETFDSVIGSSVLHHLDIDKALAEIFRVLKTGGTLYFTEPNMLNPQIAIQKNIPFIKKRMGDSPDETAFFKWQISRFLAKHGFSNIKVTPFDFLHPAIPSSLIGVIEPVCSMLESIPLVKEFAGSLYIYSQK